MNDNEYRENILRQKKAYYNLFQYNTYWQEKIFFDIKKIWIIINYKQLNKNS